MARRVFWLKRRSWYIMILSLTALRYNRTLRLIVIGAILFFVVLFLTGCGVTTVGQGTAVILYPTAIPAGTVLPTFDAGGSSGLSPTSANAVPTVAPVAVPTVNAAWQPIVAGLDYLHATITNSVGQQAGLLIARIDPTRISIKAKYTPGQVKSLSDWLGALPGALLIVNANYFDASHNPIGLVSVDGATYGASITRSDAGMFQMIGTTARVRSLYQEPYNQGEHFDEAVQGFPMLVVQGQAAPAFDSDLDNTPHPRTVVAQDRSGHIYVIVTSPGSASLSDMAHWLANSGLGIDTALNLDGGGSTFMYMATGGALSLTQGPSPVPVALAAYSR
jgi:hypothetical protein